MNISHRRLIAYMGCTAVLTSVLTVGGTVAIDELRLQMWADNIENVFPDTTPTELGSEPTAQENEAVDELPVCEARGVTPCQGIDVYGRSYTLDADGTITYAD